MLYAYHRKMIFFQSNHSLKILIKISSVNYRLSSWMHHCVMMCIWWSVIFMVSLSEFPLSACVFPGQVLCPMNHSLSVPLHCIYFTYEQIRNPTWCATNKHDGRRLLRAKQLSWDFKGNFYFNVKPSGNRTHKHTHS